MLNEKRLDEIARAHGLIYANSPEFPESCDQIYNAMRQAIDEALAEAVKVCEGTKSEAWASEVVTRAHNTAASNCAAAIRAMRSNVK